MKYTFLFKLFAPILFVFIACGEVGGTYGDDGSSPGTKSKGKSVVINGLSAYNGNSGLVLVASFRGVIMEETYAGQAFIANGKIEVDLLEYYNGDFGDPWTGSGKYLLSLGIVTEPGTTKRFLYTNGRNINCNEIIDMYTYNFTSSVSTFDFSKFKEFDDSTCEGMNF